METRATNNRHAPSRQNFWAFFGLLVFALALTSCEINTNKPATHTGRRNTLTGTDVSTNNPLLKAIVVAWNPNRESTVNSAGGGYRVYFSTTVASPAGVSAFVTAAYASGTLAPTTISIPNLTSGTYFVQIVAFSAINAAGATSTVTSVIVP